MSGLPLFAEKTGYQTVPPFGKEELRPRALGRRLLPGSIGFWLAVVAFVGHIVLDMTLLCSYCTEYGCMQKGCGHGGPACIPAYSDIYLPSVKTWQTGWLPVGNARADMAKAVSLTSRAIAEPYLMLLAFLFLESRTRREQSFSRRCAFSAGLVLVSGMTLLMTLMQNAGETKTIHILAACGLILTWLLVVGPLFLQVMPARGGWTKVVTFLWALMCVEVACLNLTWHLSSKWLLGVGWLMTEWALMFTHGVAITCIGMALMAQAK